VKASDFTERLTPSVREKFRGLREAVKPDALA